MARLDGFRNPLQALWPATNAEARKELLKAEAEAFEMIAAHVQDDIADAIMAYRSLARYAGQEYGLKKQARVSIERAQQALQVFEQHLKEGFEGGAKSIDLYRARIQLYLLSLQSAQSNLARRIEWMRAALSDLEKNPNASKVEDGLPLSVPPNERPGWVDTKEDTKE